jgi:splicing factor 3A subunit 3
VPVAEPAIAPADQVDAEIEAQRLAARARAEGADPESVCPGSSALAPAFSGEEGYGRYLDLQDVYQTFLNVPAADAAVRRETRYLDWLGSLADFSVFRPEHRATGARAYRDYLAALSGYLAGFHTRIAPLVDVDALLAEGVAKDQAAGGASGGGASGGGASSGGASSGGASGAGPWCEVCDRGFSSEAMFERHLPGKKHVKAAARKAAAGNAGNAGKAGAGAAAATADATGSAAASEETPRMVVQRLEAQVRVLCDALEDQLEATKAHVEAKQTRTLGEIEQDMEAAALGEDLNGADAVDTDSDDEGKPLYNPLNLPMGHDGKPIPFWLYKLQGLGNKFVCEICGNHEYRGPRAYEKHFQEARHNHGMRCLGVPNTLHFHGLTRIDEVLEVFRKQKAGLERDSWRPELEEEFEDAQGNVLTRKVRDDLARQGLL